MSPEEALRVGLALLAIGGAAVVKGVTGFGFPLTAAPLVSIALDARSAVIILSVVALFGNVGIMLRGGGSRATFRRLAPMLGGLVVGTIVGAHLVASVDPATLGLVVGASTLAFAALSLTRPDLAVPARLERYLGLPMGLGGGLLGGSTSIFAPIIAAYLHALHLGKREFVFFITLLYSVAGLVQVVSYAQLGFYTGYLLLVIAAALVPNAIGLSIGLRIQDRVDPFVFRRVVLVVIFLSGLSLVVKALWR